MLFNEFQGMHRRFVVGQALATFGAMTFNYAVNNALTYRDMRLRVLLGKRCRCSRSRFGCL